jgi:hypothetical protein
MIISLSDLGHRGPERWTPALGSLPLALQLGGARGPKHNYSWSLYEADESTLLAREVGIERVLPTLLIRAPMEESEILSRGLVRVRDLRIARATLATALEELRHIEVAPLGPQQPSLDGHSLSLTAPSAGVISPLEWISDGPPKWQALVQWALRMRIRLWQTFHPDEQPIEIASVETQEPARAGRLDPARVRARIAQAASWCSARLRADDLQHSLRTADLEPGEMTAASVEALAEARARHLSSAGAAVAEPAGRLLAFDPGQSLSDGAAAAASRLFFDDDNTPPWDTWVTFVAEAPQSAKRWTEFDSYLLCWIPAELSAVVQRAIDVNPEQCIRWAADLERPFIAELKRTGAV